MTPLLHLCLQHLLTTVGACTCTSTHPYATEFPIPAMLRPSTLGVDRALPPRYPLAPPCPFPGNRAACRVENRPPFQSPSIPTVREYAV